MNRSIAFTLAALAAAGAAQAQETGRVLSTTPVIQQVQVPRQVCSSQQVAVQQPKSGAGAAMGAIAGGAVGNQIGGGSGKAVATVLGVVGGLMLGERIEGPGATQVQNVQNCTTQVFYENRAASYNVTYEFNGKQYTVNLPYDPGPTVQLQVTPVAAPVQPMPVQPLQPLQPAPVGTISAPVSALPAPVTTTITSITPLPTYVAAAPMVVPTPYHGYYARPWYPPVSLSFGYVHHGGGHRHWR